MGHSHRDENCYPASYECSTYHASGIGLRNCKLLDPASIVKVDNNSDARSSSPTTLVCL
jgi:hypothetical protein